MGNCDSRSSENIYSGNINQLATDVVNIAFKARECFIELQYMQTRTDSPDQANIFCDNGSTSVLKISAYTAYRSDHAFLRFAEEDVKHTFKNKKELKSIIEQRVKDPCIGLWASLDRLVTIAVHLHACKQQSSLT
jgi:hypothetical protein